jgi:hypothetical protein
MTKEQVKTALGWTGVALLFAAIYMLWCISEGVYPWRNF